MADVDWDDPCAALVALRPVYFRLMSGAVVEEVKHKGKTVRYSAANLRALGREIARLESACAARTGARPPRHAIRFGGVLK